MPTANPSTVFIATIIYNGDDNVALVIIILAVEDGTSYILKHLKANHQYSGLNLQMSHKQ